MITTINVLIVYQHGDVTRVVSVRDEAHPFARSIILPKMIQQKKKQRGS